MDDAAQRLQEIKTDERHGAGRQGRRRAVQAAPRIAQGGPARQRRSGRGRRRWRRGGGGGGGGGNDDGIPPTAQLKMLKSLQQEINDRTEALDEQRRRHKKLTPEQTAELKRLAEDQGVLADLVRDMTRPRRDDGEE